MLGAILGAGLKPLVEDAFHWWKDWYLRPQVSASYSASHYVFGGKVDGGYVHNYIELIDDENNCGVLGLQVKGYQGSFQPWGASTQSLITVLLKNTGRSPASDLKVILLGQDLKEVDVRATPNITFTATYATTTTLVNRVVVSINSLPSRSVGALTFREAVGTATVKIAINGDETSLEKDVKGPERQIEVFAGKEAGDSPVPLGTLAVWDALMYQHDIFYPGERLLMPSLPTRLPDPGRDVTWEEQRHFNTGGCPQPAGIPKDVIWQTSFIRDSLQPNETHLTRPSN